MSAIGGNFRGEGERVEVVLEDDGYWYLRGNSKQNSFVVKRATSFGAPAFSGRKSWRLPLPNIHNLAGKAISIRFVQ